MVVKMVYLEVTSFIHLCNLENVTNNTRKKGLQFKNVRAHHAASLL